MVRKYILSDMLTELVQVKYLNSLTELLTGMLCLIPFCICSQVSGFISGEFTILENVFRLFLANGNEPLDLTELSLQLSQRLGDDTYRTSPGILARLLKNARYYGIRQLPV